MRVPFGVTCSSFLLTATILHHIRRAPLSMASTTMTLGKSFYVDDLMTGADTDDEAAKFCKEAQQLMLSAGMNLRKWTTNSRELKNLLEGDHRSTSQEMVVLHKASVKVLGIAWSPQSDEFSFSMANLLACIKAKSDTKRFVLQVASRVVDPTGFIAPYTVSVRILFQKIWTR